MDALVMCGGRGTRLETATEKPLLEIGERAMIDLVLLACTESRVDRVVAAVSPHVPETRAHLAGRSIELIETPGRGYVPDLEAALESVSTPVLTVAADLPLLRGEVIDEVLAAHERGSMTVCVPAVVTDLFGANSGFTIDRGGRVLAPTGLNIVGGGDEDEVYVSYDAGLAVNVNRMVDAQLAERLR